MSAAKRPRWPSHAGSYARALAAALTLAVASVSATTAAATHDDSPEGGPNGTHGSLDWGFTGSTDSSEPPDAGEQEPQRPGEFSSSNTTLDGTYVKAEADPEAGRLRNVTIGGTRFFDSLITPGRFNVTVNGDAAILEGLDFRLAIHDHPVGLIKFSGSDGGVQVEPAVDANVREDGDVLHIQASDRSGYLVGATHDRDLLLNDGGFFKLNGASVQDLARVATDHAGLIEEAIADGRVAAQIQFLQDAYVVLPYMDVQTDVHRMSNGTFRIVVSGDHGGRHAVLLNVERDVVRSDKVAIRYYEEALGALAPDTLRPAAGFGDALNPRDDEPAEYWWVSDPHGLHAAFTFDGGRIQAFDVTFLRSDDPPAIFFGIALGGLFSLAAGAALVSGRIRHAPRRYPRPPQTP